MDNPEFLESISLIRSLPCLAEPGKIIVIGQPSRSLDDVLPYLATLPNVISFNPNTKALTLRRQPGFITLQTDKVYITQAEDIDNGLALLDALKEAINATWQNRKKLRPVTQARKAPRPLDIYELLPQTNCKQCGEATCMAFACNLLLQKRRLEDCKPLYTGQSYADRLATLQAML